MGDIVLVQYSQKFSKHKFRLARILELHPDACGRVRTVTAGLRDRHKAVGEAWDECKSGLSPMRLPVQRLVMVLPMAEQAHQPGAAPTSRGEVELIPEEETGRQETATQADPPVAALQEQEPAAPQPQRPRSARSRRLGNNTDGRLRVSVPSEVTEVRDL